MPFWFESIYSEEEESADRIHARVERLVEDMGLDRFAFALRTSPRGGNTGNGLEAITNYPDEWVAHYLGCRYELLDPVFDMAKHSNRPFFWGGGRFLRDLRKPQRAIFNEAREFGLIAGLAIPIHGADGRSGFFTVAGDAPGRVRAAVSVEHERLFAAAFDLYDFMLSQLPDRNTGPAAGLSIRERECLLWTAEGKTAEEVASILGLSVFTVNRHASNAAQKLGCANKHHAAIRALRAGLI